MKIRLVMTYVRDCNVKNYNREVCDLPYIVFKKSLELYFRFCLIITFSFFIKWSHACYDILNCK